MAYNPQSKEEFRDEYGGGRYGADSRRNRPDEPAVRPEQPNDFRDYNHGPDSYPPPRQQPDRRDENHRPDDQRSYGRGWNDMDDHRDRGRRR